MEINKTIYERLDSLNFDQLMAFCVFNAERTVHLYELFDEMIQRENLEPLNGISNGTAVLNKALDLIKDLYEDINQLNQENIAAIEVHLNNCDLLMPDDEDYGGYETTIAQFVCSVIRYTLSYSLKREIKYPKQISDCLFNIINNIVSESYFIKYGNNNFGEKRKVVLTYYEKEVQIQINFINQLNNTTSLELVSNEALKMKIDPEDYLA